MGIPNDDTGLNDLLALAGVVFVVDLIGNHWAKFVVKKITPSQERPHGISYSLTLHADDGSRLVGYDNAHAVSTGSGPSGRKSTAFDHRHRHTATRPYALKDAVTLMQEFWNDVEAVLHEKGIS
jgi:Family of unknown function (DUF6516)